MAVNLQTIKDIRRFILSELSGLYSHQESEVIAETVIAKVFDLTRMTYLLRGNEPITDRGKTLIVKRYCRELRTGKPLQYVLGETTFFNCRIKVGRGVLIPRPETEELVDIIIKENTGFDGRITDLCTGSGCIAIALSLNLPGAKVTGIDISEAAIKRATENALLNRAEVTFIKDDIVRPKSSQIKNSDLIVSNPPYVRNSEKSSMNRNILDFEPHRALFVPDSDPLKYYHAILDLSNKKLNPGGSIYFEINEAMGAAVSDLFESYNYNNIRILKDINGKDRFAYGRKLK